MFGGEMGIAGMILGIIALIFVFIMELGVFWLFWAFPIIAVGLLLSGVGFHQGRKRGRGTVMAIAGLTINVVALAIVTLITVAIVAIGQAHGAHPFP